MVLRVDAPRSWVGWQRVHPGWWQEIRASQSPSKAEAYERLMEICELAAVYREPGVKVEYLILPLGEKPGAQQGSN